MRSVLRKTAKAKWARLLRDESGTATVEVVLWMPVMVALFGLVVDTAMIFGGRSQILRVMQDTNRAVSIGRITSADAAEAAILSSIQQFAPGAVVETTLVSGVIKSVVTVPAGNLTATGLVDSFKSLNVTVTAQHLAEN